MKTIVTFAALLVTAPLTTQTHREADDLDQRLRASSSATATLHDWCASHGIADPTIHAELVRGRAPPATPKQRRELQATATEPLGYRHVRLSCAGHVLSDAEYWYVPSRLTPAMNTLLGTTDTPFGTVVKSLGIDRRTLGTETLWRRGKAPPPQLFRHRALVLDGQGRPIAEVVETYQREAIALR